MDQQEPGLSEAADAAPPPSVQEVPVYEVSAEPRPGSDDEPPVRRRVILPIVLFAATCLTTFFAGAETVIPPHANQNWLTDNLARVLTAGFQYSGVLMGILLAHEMGHFLQSVRYGVPASFPLFIPMPFNPIGTMGAVILQRSGRADRKAMFDIAISGPLAGLVLALPALIVGLSYSQIALLPRHGTGMFLGEPLIVKWLIRWQFGTIPPGQDVMLHPIGLAGSWGIFITALNLIPISQLDGGHILYTLLGKWAHVVARLLWQGALVAMIYGGLFVSPQIFGWSLMLFLVWLIGLRHPPTSDDQVPLGRVRCWLGWLTLLFFVIGFTPFPIYEKSF
jgi:membrane-associated protease RseP (regulator of RpoE activity)